MKRRHGKKSDDRFEYLQTLIKEFYTSNQLGAKKEVIANLANFAYNPINYEYFRQLNISSVFLENLTDSNCDEDVLRSSVAGLCNLSPDPVNKGIIISKGGVEKISKLLTNSDNGIVLAALTTLIYLVAPSSHKTIASEENVGIVRRLRESNDARVRNMATIFIEDLCTDVKNTTASS